MAADPIVLKIRGISLDKVTRIINVHWAGGAIFIVITSDGPYRIAVKGRNTVVSIKITVPNSSKGPVNCFVSSYKRIGAVPTFLMSGFVNYEDEDGGAATASAIVTSNNGLDWFNRFLSETAPDVDPTTGTMHSRQSVVNAVVWSESANAFYYDQRVSRLIFIGPPPGLTGYQHEQVFTSANGLTWSGPIVDQEITFGAEPAGYRSPFPPAYCSHNDCIDTLGQNVPDGHMQRDVKGVRLKPATPTTISYGIPSYDYGASNSIVSSEHGTLATSLTRVSCVGGAGGIWMVGGTGGAALSFDDGETWTAPLVLPNIAFYSVQSISAAPLSDFVGDYRIET